MANWTLSKQVYQNGYNDIQKLRSRAQHLSIRPAAQRQVLGRLPAARSARASAFLNTSNRLSAGWSADGRPTFSSPITPGFPWRLPTNFIYVKEAKLPNIDWNAPIVQVVSPAWRSGIPTGPSPCSLQHEGRLHRLQLPERCRSSRRRPSRLFRPDPDHERSQRGRSLNKTTRITERASVQFRAEVFNVTTRSTSTSRSRTAP